MKPFYAWLMVDDEGTYSPVMHITRREAMKDKQDHSHLIDAKWRVVRVKVMRVDRVDRTVSR
jgi:hypothetical protein